MEYSKRSRKRIISAEDGQRAIDLYNGGLSMSAVATELLINDRLMKDFLRERVSLRKKRSMIKWIDDQHIECSKCNSIKHESLFTFSTRGLKSDRGGHYLSYCKECRHDQQTLANKNRPFSWRDKHYRTKSRAAKIGVEFNLDIEYLELLWDLQGGKCIYTGNDILLGEGRNPQTLSIDKINPRKGYIKGNIALCINRANSIKMDQTLEELKEWMPGWHQSAMDLLHIVALAENK